MMPERWRPERVFVYRHPVDMRKQIDGLAALVATELGQDPADRSLYVFTNRGRDKIKLLIWHLNGYWLLYKRVEKQRFQWPDWFEGDSLTLTHEQLEYLLDGYNLNGMRPHRTLSFAHTI
jgi:transposase